MRDGAVQGQSPWRSEPRAGKVGFTLGSKRDAAKQPRSPRRRLANKTLAAILITALLGAKIATAEVPRLVLCAVDARSMRDFKRGPFTPGAGVRPGRCPVL